MLYICYIRTSSFSLPSWVFPSGYISGSSSLTPCPWLRKLNIREIGHLSCFLMFSRIKHEQVNMERDYEGLHEVLCLELVNNPQVWMQGMRGEVVEKGKRLGN